MPNPVPGRVFACSGPQGLDRPTKARKECRVEVGGKITRGFVYKSRNVRFEYEGRWFYFRITNFKSDVVDDMTIYRTDQPRENLADLVDDYRGKRSAND